MGGDLPGIVGSVLLMRGKEGELEEMLRKRPPLELKHFYNNKRGLNNCTEQNAGCSEGWLANRCERSVSKKKQGRQGRK